MDAVLRVEDLRKELKLGEVAVHALRGVSLNVHRGEFMGIIGPSGSGKSTLLGLIGGLDTPTGGKVFIDGTDITVMNERALTRIRNEKIGFVFQFFNLIPTLTALENVALPMQFSTTSQRQRQQARQRTAGYARLGRPAQSSPDAAFRRSAAARGDCPRARQQSAAGAVRRADRQPRHAKPAIRS